MSKKLTLEDVKKLQTTAANQRQQAVDYWINKIHLMSPKLGDILIIPQEAKIDLQALGIAISSTPIKYALIVPQGKLELMPEPDIQNWITSYVGHHPEFKKKLLEPQPAGAAGGDGNKMGEA